MNSVRRSLCPFSPARSEPFTWLVEREPIYGITGLGRRALHQYEQALGEREGARSEGEPSDR